MLNFSFGDDSNATVNHHMTNAKIKVIVTKTHFCLLGIALFNFFLKTFAGVSLNYRLAYVITLLVYASGLILFIWNFRQLKRLAIYFSIYAITAVVTVLFFLLGGIFLAMLASLVLFPIYPPEIEGDFGKYIVYSKYQGFMGPCCPAEITEVKLLVFEKKIATINLGNVNFQNVSIDSKAGTQEMRIEYGEHDFDAEKTIVSDTIISIQG